MKVTPLSALFVLVITAYYIGNSGVLATCDSWFGPAGTTHCVELYGYHDYQWATCRTDTYIKTKSKNSHQCVDSSRIYCYYQCMLDVYDKNFGDILPPCKCFPGDPVPTESVPLPPWCYSPAGKTCSWYTECLNKAYPQCKDTKDDYAIDFAETFCNLYNERYSEFSSQGQRWIDAVRKCLQLKLVPLLDTTRDKTCADLKSTAFQSHTPCYLNPDETSLSYCELSYLDRFQVFWTIKSALSKAFLPSLKGYLEARLGCLYNSRLWAEAAHYWKRAKELIKKKDKATSTYRDKKTEDVIIEKTKIRIKTWLEDIVSPIPVQLDLFVESDNLPKFVRRRKRSVEDDEDIARSKFAGKVLDDVALKENWKETGVAWFGYANNETSSENNTMSIRLFVADRYKYDVGNTSLSDNTSSSDNTSLSETKAANLTTTLVKLSKAVLMGTLNLTVDGESIKIMKLVGCLDWDCKEHAFNITALKLQENNGTVSNGNKSRGAVMYGAMHTLLLPSFVFLVINILFSSIT